MEKRGRLSNNGIMSHVNRISTSALPLVLLLLLSGGLSCSCNSKESGKVGNTESGSGITVIQTTAKDGSTEKDIPTKNNTSQILTTTKIVVGGNNRYSISVPEKFEKSETDGGNYSIISPIKLEAEPKRWEMLQIIYIPNNENITLDSLVKLNSSNIPKVETEIINGYPTYYWKRVSYVNSAKGVGANVVKESYFLRKENTKGEIYRIELTYAEGDEAWGNLLRKCVRTFELRGLNSNSKKVLK